MLLIALLLALLTISSSFSFRGFHKSNLISPISLSVSNGISHVDRKTELLNLLGKIIDPLSGDDIVTAGCIKELDVSSEGLVTLSIENDDLRQLCQEELLSNLPWITKIQQPIVNEVILNVPEPLEVTDGLSGVKHILAVSSCKGGVGKSTVAVNLAYTLQQAGARVGILDADIYGPSLPTMTRPLETDVVYVDNKLKPLEYEGVKLMSMGFINKGASIMRGPMVNQVLRQFVQLCDWGDLDYLILDMPPGTGDIQLTLSQIMNISAAIIVTTPQRLSFVDVVKGIDLYDTVNIPCIAVVENMAEFTTYKFTSEFYESLKEQINGLYTASVLFSHPTESTNGTEDRLGLVRSLQDTTKSVTNLIQSAIEAQKLPMKIFGTGHVARLKEMWGIENIVSLPLQESISACGDKGVPYVLAHPTSDVADKMVELATVVLQELDRLASASRLDNENGANDGAIRYNAQLNRILYPDESHSLTPYKLRINCRCAACVEEFTGRQLLDVSTVPGEVRPLAMGRIGRYAVSVDWSDGHKSLYPFRAIAGLVESVGV